MKKILYIILVILPFASCRKAVSPYAESEKLISILEQEVYFQPDGGQGYVCVAAQGAITAESARPWCRVSVDGKKVIVDVDEFNDMQSRYSKVVIRCGADSVSTTVHQQGVIIEGFKVSDVYFGTSADSLSVPYKANVRVKTECSQPWISTKVVSDTLKLYAARNDEGRYREGTVTCTIGASQYTIKVAQVDVAEVKAVSDWTLRGTSPSGSALSLDASLSPEGVFTLTGEGINWTVRPTFSNGRVLLPLSKTSIGNYMRGESNLLVFVSAGGDAVRAASTEVTMVGTFAFGARKDAQGKWLLMPVAGELSSRYNPLCLRFDMWSSSKTSVMQEASSYSIVFKDPEFKQK